MIEFIFDRLITIRVVKEGFSSMNIIISSKLKIIYLVLEKYIPKIIVDDI